MKNSKRRNAKIPLLTFFLFTLLCICGLNTLWAEVDLIDQGKSDTAVKMLVFPKSLRVIENKLKTTGELEAALSDSKRIRKTLLKIDPARVVPAKAGEPFSGAVSRERLLKLSKQYSEDVIFIFRRNLKTGTPKIHYQGLLYLARQKKVLVLKGNNKNETFSDSDSPQEKTNRLMTLDEEGLKDLAREARAVLHSHKFEKRQSAY